MSVRFTSLIVSSLLICKFLLDKKNKGVDKKMSKEYNWEDDPVQIRLAKIAVIRTELNKRESAMIKLFNLRDEWMSKVLIGELDWESFENILNDIQKKLEIKLKDFVVDD
ncbi:hypothetical protein LCGC14_0770250 [marine sediment metagenome]|uniref:Uncharacterized protein n=1 Tax=marine sediment metagenome TaxID=412755 RepID=A0A0F9PYM8_9ZZZZ